MNILSVLKGKRTYIVCVAMLAYAILGLILGKLDNNSASTLILEALAIAGLRAGVAKK